MKKLLCGMALLSAAFQLGAAAQWLTSVPEALKKAQAEDKAVLLDFTGSDWCGWCKKLKREVFDQKDFIEFANANFVLVEVDFPHHKKLPAALQEENNRLKQRFGVDGYPTIIVLDKSGRLALDTGYVEGGPKRYIAELKRARGIRWKAPIPSPDADPGPAQASETTEAPAPVEPERPRQEYKPAYIPPPAPIRYDGLALKGIMGKANKKLAIINNETVAAGETAKVKVGDKTVKILCKEIREESVLVVIEGKADPIELELGKKEPAATR